MSPFQRNVANEINYTGRYEWQEWVGEGGQGMVGRAQSVATGETVAIKVMDRNVLTKSPNVEYSKKRILREIQNHKRLTGHPLIVEFKEIFLTKSFLCIVMEYAWGGDMNSYVAKCYNYRVPLCEDEARAWFQQFILAIDFSHQNNIVNRDIKLENALLAQNLSENPRRWWALRRKYHQQEKRLWNLKLCDFGYSRDILHNKQLISRVGTPSYTSPDVLYADSEHAYDGVKQDIWSCGIVLYILLFSRFPFDPTLYYKNRCELLRKIKQGDFTYPQDSYVSYEAKNLINWMLQANPEKRCSLKDVIRHPWFQKNLPQNWQLDFQDQVNKKQETLQSDLQIIMHIETVFS